MMLAAQGLAGREHRCAAIPPYSTRASRVQAQAGMRPQYPSVLHAHKLMTFMGCSAGVGVGMLGPGQAGRRARVSSHFAGHLRAALT